MKTVLKIKGYNPKTQQYEQVAINTAAPAKLAYGGAGAFRETLCATKNAERLHQWFGLNLLYSGKLGLYILCVEHWGTSWDYVPCPVFDRNVADYIKNNGLEFKH